MSKADFIVNESEKAFLAEGARMERLTTKAEKYAGAIAVIIGLHLIDFNRIKLSGNSRELLYVGLAAGALISLGLAMGLTLLSVRIRNYRSYPVGMTLIDELKNEALTEDGAKMRIAGMYLKAHDANSRTNDRRAKLLSYGSVLMVFGFALAVATRLADSLIR